MEKRYSLPMTFVGLVLMGGLSVWAGSARAEIDMNRTYFIGDSYTAGFMHGSMYEGFQVCAFPALLAEQLGFRLWDDFAMPRYGFPGIPGMLVLQRLFPVPMFSRIAGEGQNLTLDDPRIYNNLGVPGASVRDLFLSEASTENEDVFFKTILRQRGSVLEQIERVHPKMTFVWIGINETSPALALGFVFPGLTVTMPDEFDALFGEAIQRIRAATSGPVVVFDIPDMTMTPFCHFLPTYVFDFTTGQPILDANGNPVPLIGPEGPLTPDACVFERAFSWILKGWGIPESLGGNGLPLPNTVVFTPNEVRAVQNFIRLYNSIIELWVDQLPGVHLFRISQRFERWAVEGIHLGGVTITWQFPLGGFWALDAFHPGPVGHAAIANALIEYLDREFGETIPPIDFGPLLRGERCGFPLPVHGARNRPDQSSRNVGAEWIPK